MENKTYYNYKKSLEQKYNAVCFSIDGTLTEKNSKKIDNRAINMIIELLKKKVPVVFITGRGETGLHDLKQDIYDAIIISKNINENDIKRIYVLTNDGARLFFSTDISNKDFLEQSTYITTNSELEQLVMMNDMLKKIDNNYFDIMYSKDSKTDKIINIRLVLNTEDVEKTKKIYNNINEIICNNQFESIHLTRGFYKDKAVIQIGTTTKDKAIEKVEKLLGIPKNSMMRIGSCGDDKGNDYLMLNCNQGYSVNKTSSSDSSCFPIFDKNKNILKGVEATLELIANSKILPTVCLEKVDKKDYKYNFAKTEKNIVLGRKKLLNKYNNLVNINFKENDGIDSLFDKASGSVIIPMYEWELISSNPLKDFWSSKKNNCFKYIIKDDNNYLLRGSSTYYYFLANRKSENGKDITTKDNVVNWHNNYIEFISDAIQAIFKTKDINSNVNKKMLLGILDNCRNILLILMNHMLVSDYYGDNILIDISSKNNINFYKMYNRPVRKGFCLI